jgi:hypothetical protein
VRDPAPRLQHRGYIGRRGLHRGDETGDDCRDQGDAKREPHHATVYGRRRPMDVREEQSSEKHSGGIRHDERRDPGGKREQQSLGEQQPD